MPRVRRARRHSRSAKRPWAVAAIAVALTTGAVVLAANSRGAAPPEGLQSSVWVSFESGWGHGGNVMTPGADQLATVTGTAAQLSPQARQRLSATRETSEQALAADKRQHTQEYQYYLGHKRLLAQDYQKLLSEWRALSTATTTSAATTTAQTTAPTALPSTAPAASSAVTATATPADTSTATPTDTSAATPTAGVGQVTSPTWAGYAATGAAGTFTSVAANWIVPPVACSGVASRSSFGVGLDGDGTSTIEQIGTEGDCAGDFGVYSGWFQMAPNAPVFFKNPVKPGDAMTASVTAMGGGNFMLSLFDMTQNWVQSTQQTSAAATLGSAEIIAQDPPENGQAQPLANFGIVDFLGAAVNNAAITAPIKEVTMVSAAGNTLAVPSTLTGGVGNFAVGWDAAA